MEYRRSLYFITYTFSDMFVMVALCGIFHMLRFSQWAMAQCCKIVSFVNLVLQNTKTPTSTNRKIRWKAFSSPKLMDSASDKQKPFLKENESELFFHLLKWKPVTFERNWQMGCSWATGLLSDSVLHYFICIQEKLMRE